MGTFSLDCFDDFTARFIRGKVRQLIGRASFVESDRDDLLQDFALDLLQRRERFNPQTAGWEAFVVVVCENRYATILAHRRAQKRSHAREGGSLSRPIQDAEGGRTEFGATVSESEQARHTGQHQRSQQELCELMQDVARVLDQLPPLMRKVCEIVMRDSKAAAARQLGMSQGALYEVLGRVLTRFDKAGLRGYLK